MSLYSAEELKYDPSVACFPVAICLEAGGASASAEVHSAVQSQSTFATLGGLGKGGTLVIKPLKQKIQACMGMGMGMGMVMSRVCLCMRHVLRLDVSMRHPKAMHVFERRR